MHTSISRAGVRSHVVRFVSHTPLIACIGTHGWPGGCYVSQLSLDPALHPHRLRTAERWVVVLDAVRETTQQSNTLGIPKMRTR
jgi:hypothetical protein